MSRGIIIQSIEFLEDDLIAFSWAYEEDVNNESYGEVRRTWVDLSQLPEHVGDRLRSAVDDLIDEYHIFKRDAPDFIEPK